jgi:hypothetical protein
MLNLQNSCEKEYIPILAHKEQILDDSQPSRASIVPFTPCACSYKHLSTIATCHDTNSIHATMMCKHACLQRCQHMSLQWASGQQPMTKAGCLMCDRVWLVHSQFCLAYGVSRLHSVGNRSQFRKDGYCQCRGHVQGSWD